MITQYQGGHRFDDRDRSRQNTWIVTTPRRQGRFLARRSHRFLLARDSGGWLEGDPEENILAIADATLDTAGSVGCRPHFSVAKFEGGIESAHDLSRDGAGGHAADCLAGGGAPTALPIADTVFRFVGEIGVRRAVGRFHFGVSFGPGVLIHHHDGDWSPKGAAFKN